MRFSIRTLLIATFCFAAIIAAGVRGHFLLGANGAMIFCVLSFGLVYLFARSLTAANAKTAKLSLVFLLTCGVLFFFLRPASFGWQVQSWIGRHQGRVRRNAELNAIIQSVPYAEGVRCRLYKASDRYGDIIDVTGSLPNSDVLAELESALGAATDLDAAYHFKWNVELTDN